MSKETNNGRYLVTWKGLSMSLDQLESGYDLWNETLREFPVRNLHTFGNLSEGHIVCIFDAPSIDDIRLLNQRMDARCLEVHGKYTGDIISEIGMDIQRLRFIYGATYIKEPYILWNRYSVIVCMHRRLHESEVLMRR